MRYRSGIFRSSKCKSNANEVNHAVLAVGYGREKLKDKEGFINYYIVKNSWSEDFGEKGYFKIE